MYVCLCRAITDKDIQSAAQNDGICTLKQLCCKLGVAQECGKCAPHAKEVLENSRKISANLDKGFSLDNAIAT